MNRRDQQKYQAEIANLVEQLLDPDLTPDITESAIDDAVDRYAALQDVEECAKILLYSGYPTVGLVRDNDPASGLLQSGISKFPFQLLARESVKADVLYKLRSK